MSSSNSSEAVNIDKLKEAAAQVDTDTQDIFVHLLNHELRIADESHRKREEALLNQLRALNARINELSKAQQVPGYVVSWFNQEYTLLMLKFV